MNKQATIKILAMITNLWPSQPTHADAIDAWHMILCDYAVDDVAMAVKRFVETKGSAFPPNVSELIGIVKSQATRAIPQSIVEPSRNMRVELEHYELNGRRYIRASKGARRAMAEYYRCERE